MDKKALILLVDDEPSILETLTFTLNAEGFEVLTASNGQECIELAKTHKPDIILLDFKMPVMNGVDAFEKLKEDPETKDIKVVFLSAFNNPQEVAQEIDPKYASIINDTPIIRKGIGLEEFGEEVKKYL